MVKANAYGHGAVPVARAMLAAGAPRLAVHRAIEGVELRRGGIEAPILVMGYTPPAGAEMVAQWRLTPSVITLEFAQALSGRAAALGSLVPVHVKIDSGMSRYGIMPSEVGEFLQALARLPGLSIEGLFTHFACADMLDPAPTHRQLQVFEDTLRATRGVGIQPALIHAANSAAAMRLPETHFNAIRPGIGLYGLDPSTEWPPGFELQPALTLKSRVSRVRTLPPEAGVSYGHTFVTQAPTRAALVPVGYGDGYARILSNRSSVLVGGQRASMIGRVCMDQFVVDISHIPEVRQDDEVVLVGSQGQERIRAEEVASLAGTINYEVTTSLLPRVVRVYRQGGKIVEITALGGATA